jgi:serine/threonine-protein kinase
MRTTPRAAAALVSALVLAIETSGAAQPEDPTDRVATAQGLYESAGALIKAGRFAEACPKLEESQRLDPAMGTQFFLATCYESTGRPTSAWLAFLQVAARAKEAGNVQRETTARARAAALEPKLPRLAVVVSDAVARLPGVKVWRDGAELKPVVWGSGVPVDLGEHTVRVAATGKAPWEATVTLRELGERREVKVPPLQEVGLEGGAPRIEPAPTAPGDGSAVPEPAAAASRGIPGQRIAALVVGSGGVAGLAVGTALGLVARSAWDRAVAACPTQHACNADAHDASLRAVSFGTGSTASFAAGGVAVAGAIVLWITTPKSAGAQAPPAITLVPTARARAAGLAVAGVFR